MSNPTQLVSGAQNSARSLQMVNCLRDRLLYSEKRARDMVFRAVEEILRGSGANQFSDVEAFATFMRFLAPPKPAGPFTGTSPFSASSFNDGQGLFSSVGCALCHTPSLTTGKSSVAALSNVTVNLYSDLAVHGMGQGLADGITQGSAQGDEFRTAPLWGLGQRIFFCTMGARTT